MSGGIDLLRRHVDLFNAGVRTGDFSPMLANFTDDAELHFEGAPFGPYLGKEAVAAGYRDNPPDDEIEVLDATQQEDGVVVARYRWLDPTAPAGRMLLTTRGDEITRLVVTFEPPAS